MSIWDFLKQEEISDAPEGEQGFLELVRIAQNRLNEQVSHFDEDNQRGIIQDIQTSFSMLVLDLGKSFGIEPFASMNVVDETFGPNEYRAFRRTLDSYVNQLVVRTAIAAKRDSMEMTADTKAKIRTHLHHIKDYIDRADVDEGRRAKLHAKLAEFEAALERDRFSFSTAGVILLAMLAVASDVTGLADSDTLKKLVTGVMATVAEAKAADDKNRPTPPLTHVEPIMLPPRQRTDEDFSGNLGDDIPF